MITRIICSLGVVMREYLDLKSSCKLWLSTLITLVYIRLKPWLEQSLSVLLGLIQEFLSARFWIPLSRLTYSVYLIHMIVLSVMYLASSGTIYYDLVSIVSMRWFVIDRIKDLGKFWLKFHKKNAKWIRLGLT